MPPILEKLPLNWNLLGNPVNWVIVWLMIAMGVASIAVIANPPIFDDAGNE